MAPVTVVKRATGMPDSDVAEVRRLAQFSNSGWIISSPTLGSNATQVSNVAYNIMNAGTFTVVAASGGTAMCATGIGSLATAATGAFLWTITASGTQIGRVCAGVTIGGIVLPAVPTGETPIGLTIIACTAATAFNGGTNSLADTSYTVSHTSFTGPAGMLLATEKLSYVPG